MPILLACDLDGTLLDEHHEIDRQSLQIMTDFCAAGHTLIIATGRLDHDIVYVEQRIGFSGAFRMSQNGAIIKTHDHEVIFKQHIPQSAIEVLSPFLAQLSLRVEVSTADNRFFPTPRDPQAVAEYADSSIISGRFYADMPKLAICTILIFGTPEAFEPIRQFISGQLETEVDGFMTSPVTFEIVAKGVNKGYALQRLLDQMPKQGHFSTTAAIGDADNDVSMFPVVDESFAMSHAARSVQQRAKHVAGSVGEAIQFLLQQRGNK